jgi:cytochrome c1
MVVAFIGKAIGFIVLLVLLAFLGLIALVKKVL